MPVDLSIGPSTTQSSMKQEMPIPEIQGWFRRFTDEYREVDGVLHPLLQIKLEHSERVSNLCTHIALACGWASPSVESAAMAGLLHDVARFPQYRDHKTFLDAKSLDHGCAGYRILTGSQSLLYLLPKSRHAQILDSVRYHNKREIPSELSEESLHLLQLVRDADKLDIMVVIARAMANGQIQQYPELLINVDLDGPPSQTLIDEIRIHRRSSYEHVRTLADVNLLRLSWVYALHYRPSLVYLHEHKLVCDLTERLPLTPEISQLIHEVNAYISEQVRVREPIRLASTEMLPRSSTEA